MFVSSRQDHIVQHSLYLLELSSQPMLLYSKHFRVRTWLFVCEPLIKTRDNALLLIVISSLVFTCGSLISTCLSPPFESYFVVITKGDKMKVNFENNRASHIPNDRLELIECKDYCHISK